MTAVLVDDWLAAFALVAPEPLTVAGIDSVEFHTTYSMWLRVTVALAKVEADPEAVRGHFSSLFEDRHELGKDPDPARLTIVNPVPRIWETAVAKLQPGVSNLLRSEWIATADSFAHVYVSKGQQSLTAFTPQARVGDPVLVRDREFELS